ncbi:MAG: hypothetical protein CMJ72_13570 [Planctomycetaceae bacterium]|nr:hypothetical protein [Planctomycetaceae bacterium]HCK40112.1 hypothetical protein [Planctomycetaceae bacterium]
MGTRKGFRAASSLAATFSSENQTHFFVAHEQSLNSPCRQKNGSHIQNEAAMIPLPKSDKKPFIANAKVKE